MSRSPPPSGSPSAPGPSVASHALPAGRLWDDPLLRIAFLTVGLLLTYQLVVTLLQPSWIGSVTDWLLALLDWLSFLAVVLLSVWSTRAGQPAARSWWLVSAGLLANAVAGSIWLVEDQFLFPNHVPFPSLYDVVFALRYLFFFLALLLVPTTRPWVLKVRDVLDACPLLGAALAFSWYFLLAPLYRLSPESMLGKLVHWSYPVGDLAILFGLTLVWLRDRATELEPPVLALLTAAIVCLVVGDTWASAILLIGSGYQRGSPPDLFWMAFNLLVPLAGLVQFRLSQHAPTGMRQTSTSAKDLRRQDLLAAIRSTFPVAAALLASIGLVIRAERGLIEWSTDCGTPADCPGAAGAGA